jgi:hypothetical protein
MAVAFAPFDDSPGESSRPPLIVNKGSNKIPVSDNTECNYIALGFVVGVFLLGLTDAIRGK